MLGRLCFTWLGAESRPGYRFVYDGEAYLVGDVKIANGNCYDSWNVVDLTDCAAFARSARAAYGHLFPLDVSLPPRAAHWLQRATNPIK